VSCDLNTLLTNAAGTWPSQAAALTKSAESLEERARYMESYGGDPGLELGAPYRADAEKKKAEAAWLSRRAASADEGRLLCDPARYPDAGEQSLRADYIRAGRSLELVDPRAVRAASDLPGTGPGF
jgi:hypothetical protein